MEIFSVQIALFPKDLIRRPDQYYNDINLKMNGIFDAIPIVMSVPENAPPEFPIVQMFSSDGVYKANIARGRIDLFYLPQNSATNTNSATAIKATSIFKQFYESILSFTKIYRVGCVFSSFKEDNRAIETLAERYFIGNDFRKSSELSFYRNTPVLLKGVKMNRILKISTGKVNKGLAESEGIIIEQDINTLQSETEVISKDVVQEIIEYMASNMEEKELEKLL